MPRFREHLPDPREQVKESAAVLSHAQATRAAHRRRERFDREDELEAAIEKINAVQVENRRLIASAGYRHVDQEDKLRTLSDQLQRERRKLRKMLRRGR